MKYKYSTYEYLRERFIFIYFPLVTHKSIINIPFPWYLVPVLNKFFNRAGKIICENYESVCLYRMGVSLWLVSPALTWTTWPTPCTPSPSRQPRQGTFSSYMSHRKIVISYNLLFCFSEQWRRSESLNVADAKCFYSDSDPFFLQQSDPNSKYCVN